MTKIPCSTCLTESVCKEDGICRLNNEMKQFEDWLTDNVHISKSNSEIIKNHVSHYFTSPKNDAIQSLQADNENLEKEISLAESQLIAAQSRIEYLEGEGRRLKELAKSLWETTFYSIPVPDYMDETLYEKVFLETWQKYKAANNL